MGKGKPEKFGTLAYAEVGRGIVGWPKVISARELACIVRETLFYQCVFPGSTLGQLVPRYYGTYASCDGGWYVIILEHAGEPVQSVGGHFVQSDEKSIR